MLDFVCNCCNRTDINIFQSNFKHKFLGHIVTLHRETRPNWKRQCGENNKASTIEPPRPPCHSLHSVLQRQVGWPECVRLRGVCEKRGSHLIPHFVFWTDNRQSIHEFYVRRSPQHTPMVCIRTHTHACVAAMRPAGNRHLNLSVSPKYIYYHYYMHCTVCVCVRGAAARDLCVALCSVCVSMCKHISSRL